MSDWFNSIDMYVFLHYSDVLMSAMASQITGISIVYSTVCSGADQRKYQSSASLAFVRGIHRCLMNSLHAQRASNAENLMTSSWYVVCITENAISMMALGPDHC